MTIKKKTDPRGKIRVVRLIRALERHVFGQSEMKATQVSAALALLKKALPDLPDAARKAAAVPPRDDGLLALE